MFRSRPLLRPTCRDGNIFSPRVQNADCGYLAVLLCAHGALFSSCFSCFFFTCSTRGYVRAAVALSAAVFFSLFSQWNTADEMSFVDVSRQLLDALDSSAKPIDRHVRSLIG